MLLQKRSPAHSASLVKSPTMSLLESQTKVQLLARAKTLGLKKYSKLNKKELIVLLLQHRSPARSSSSVRSPVKTPARSASSVHSPARQQSKPRFAVLDGIKMYPKGSMEERCIRNYAEDPCDPSMCVEKMHVDAYLKRLKSLGKKESVTKQKTAGEILGNIEWKVYNDPYKYAHLPIDPQERNWGAFGKMRKMTATERNTKIPGMRKGDRIVWYDRWEDYKPVYQEILSPTVIGYLKAMHTLNKEKYGFQIDPPYFSQSSRGSNGLPLFDSMKRTWKVSTE